MKDVAAKAVALSVIGRALHTASEMVSVAGEGEALISMEALKTAIVVAQIEAGLAVTKSLLKTLTSMEERDVPMRTAVEMMEGIYQGHDLADDIVRDELLKAGASMAEGAEPIAVDLMKAAINYSPAARDKTIN